MLRRISNAGSSFLSPVLERRDSAGSAASSTTTTLAAPTASTSRRSSLVSSTLAADASFDEEEEGEDEVGDGKSTRSRDAVSILSPHERERRAALDSAHLLLVESILTLQSVEPTAYAQRLVLTSQIAALLAEYPETGETFR